MDSQPISFLRKNVKHVSGFLEREILQFHFLYSLCTTIFLIQAQMLFSMFPSEIYYPLYAYTVFIYLYTGLCHTAKSRIHPFLYIIAHIVPFLGLFFTFLFALVSFHDYYTECGVQIRNGIECTDYHSIEVNLLKCENSYLFVLIAISIISFIMGILIAVRPFHRNLYFKRQVATRREPSHSQLQNANTTVNFDAGFSNYYSMNHFSDIEIVKQGTYGILFKAKSGIHGDVVVKRFNEKTQTITEAVLLRDVSNIDHPNIIKLYGILHDISIFSRVLKTTGYIMEYMSNQSVDDALHNSTMLITEELTTSWISQAGEALLYLHENKMGHRNVKPSNMLLCNFFKTLKLSDKQVNKPIVDDLFGNVGLTGSILYLAPERMTIDRSKVPFFFGSDTYSFGISIWEILTRRRPFDHIGNVWTSDFIQKVVHGGLRPDVEAVSDIETRFLIQKAWIKNVEQRCSITEILEFFREVNARQVQQIAQMEESSAEIKGTHIFNLSQFTNTIVIGSGTYGNVFKTKTKEFGDIAAKIYKEKPTDLELREIGNMIKYSHHPNIVRFFGVVVGEAQAHIGFVMEYMSDGTVYDIVHKQKMELSWSRRFSYFQQAGQALSYLHCLGLVHRDVKPQNMLLCNDYRTLKLGDLGFSRTFGDNISMSVGIVGTPQYCAPEVFIASNRSKADYDSSVDTYSYAISVWEIISQRRPYCEHKMEIIELLTKVSEGLRPDITAIEDEEIRKMMERAWSPKPDQRPEMQELVAFFNTKSNAYRQENSQ